MVAQPMVPTPYGMPSFFVYASLEGETGAEAALQEPRTEKFHSSRLLSFAVTDHSFFIDGTELRHEELPFFTRISLLHIQLCLVPRGELRYPAYHFCDDRSIVSLLGLEQQFRRAINCRIVQLPRVR